MDLHIFQARPQFYNQPVEYSSSARTRALVTSASAILTRRFSPLQTIQRGVYHQGLHFEPHARLVTHPEAPLTVSLPRRVSAEPVRPSILRTCETRLRSAASSADVLLVTLMTDGFTVVVDLQKKTRQEREDVGTRYTNQKAANTCSR